MPSVDSRAAVSTGVKADFDLYPDQRASKTIPFSGLVNVAGEVEFHPDACRDDPSSDLFCDAFRIKVHRSKAAEARNTVRVMLTWDSQVAVPDLALVATGLGVGELPDLDMYVYDKPAHALGYDAEDDDTDTPGCQGCEGVGGRGIAIPEILGFTATQDEYDVVIQAGTGVLAGGYTITVVFSDELFDRPGEFIDDVSTPVGGTDATPSVFAPFDASGTDDVTLPALDLAPATPDADIAGIGLGVSEQFDAQGLFLGGAARRVVAAKRVPPAAELFAALGLGPAAIALAAVGFFRRRRDALI